MSLASRMAIFEKNIANNGKSNGKGGSFQKTTTSKPSAKTFVKTTHSNNAAGGPTTTVRAAKASVPTTGSKTATSSSKTTSTKTLSKPSAPKWFTEPASSSKEGCVATAPTKTSKTPRSTKTVTEKTTSSSKKVSASSPTRSTSGAWPSQYLTHNKGLVDFSKLDKKHLILYFAGQFCHVCRNVTPKMSQAYTQLKAAYPKDFELVYVSADQDEKIFQSSFASVPFGALPFEDQESKQKLLQKFGVKAFPTTIVLGPLDKKTGDRPILNNNETCNLHSVRGSIDRGTLVEDFPFYPKRHDITLGTDGIQTNRSLLIFCEHGNYQDKTAVVKAVEQVAETRKGSSSPKLFYATRAGGYADAYRGVLKMLDKKSDNGPIVVLLDWPDNGGYYLSTPKYDELTADWVDEFLNNPGERLQMTA